MMKRTLVSVGLLVLASLTWAVESKYRVDGPALLNDLTLTPGKIRTTNAHDVCSGGSTKQYRHTTPAQKNQVYAWYGATKKPGVCCEVDHLIPLELGGADDVANLWPEPYLPLPAAHQKDKLENYLHSQVCAGAISLTDAQTAISQNWYTAYQKMQADGHNIE